MGVIPQNPNEIDNLFEINRRALMESYNAQTTAHGTYLLALIGALLAVVPQWENIYKLRYGSHMFSVIIGVIVGCGSYLVLRTFFWAYLSSDVLVIVESELVVTAEPQILRLQQTVLKDFNEGSYLKHIAYVVGNRSSFWVRGLFVLFLIGVSFGVFEWLSRLLS